MANGPTFTWVNGTLSLISHRFVPPSPFGLNVTFPGDLKPTLISYVQLVHTSTQSTCTYCARTIGIDLGTHPSRDMEIEVYILRVGPPTPWAGFKTYITFVDNPKPTLVWNVQFVYIHPHNQHVHVVQDFQRLVLGISHPETLRWKGGRLQVGPAAWPCHRSWFRKVTWQTCEESL